MNNNKLQKLFSPLKIRNKKIKNRIISAAHASGFSEKGLLNDYYLNYYERKAKGGAGLIITFGSASVYKESYAAYGSVSLWDSKNEPYLKKLAKKVQAHGSLIISQATHMGRRASSERDGHPVKAPSSIPEGVHGEIPQVLHTYEILLIIKGFADAARRLDKCGWDGIEITSFGGHLIENFWSPKINNRTDEYGGSFEGRMKFSIEIVNAISKVVSDEFIISFRLTGDPLTKDLGLERDDMIEIAKRLDEIGRIDMFNITGGTGANYRSNTAMIPGDTFERSTFNHLSKIMKDNLSVPVLVAGRIFDPEQADQTIKSGEADMVSMTRSIIADPDLPILAKQGESSSIRPCIACNEGCIGRLDKGMPIICTVNPAIGDPSLEEYLQAEKIRRIIIIGGGPSGMEAAKVAAKRGHDVYLIERSNLLGGKMKYASMAKERPHYGKHIKWLKKELNNLKINVLYNNEASVDKIMDLTPDVVVIATGSIPAKFSEEPIRNNVVTDIDILKGKVTINSNKNFLIYDREGSFRGGSVANYIANNGALRVEIGAPDWSISDNLDSFRKAEMYKNLGKNNIVLSPYQELLVNKDNKLVLKNLWFNKERVLNNEEVVVLVGYEKGDNTLYNSLKSKDVSLEIHQIGDSLSPRRLHDVIKEGTSIGKIV